jgi:hypothetical protein
MRDLYSAIKAAFTIRPVTATTTQTGSTVDTKGYNSALAVLEVGAVSGTSPTLDVKIQESDNPTTGYTDVTGLTFTQVTAANNSQVLKIEGIGGTPRKRYLRAVGTIGGTSPSFTFGVEILLGRAYQQPVNS